MFDGGSRPVHPALLALSRTIDQYQLPHQPFFDLIDANLQDQRTRSYETWEDLLAYCTLSAAPVGRMVLAVFRVLDPAALRLSDDVCIGLQLANFAQDVAVDRTKGRTYLLQSDLRAGGVSVAVRRMAERAQQLLASGEELEMKVQGRLRVQLALYRLGGQAILSAIERTGYRTDLRRPTVSPITKLTLLTTAAARLLAGESDAERLRTPAI
jgi:phytoene/squalene synthetase